MDAPGAARNKASYAKMFMEIIRQDTDPQIMDRRARRGPMQAGPWWRGIRLWDGTDGHSDRSRARMAVIYDRFQVIAASQTGQERTQWVNIYRWLDRFTINARPVGGTEECWYYVLFARVWLASDEKVQLKNPSEVVRRDGCGSVGLQLYDKGWGLLPKDWV